MPQFDKVTFFNQIFWFLVGFLSFYFIILKGLLPVLAVSLKTRKKVMNYIFLAGSLDRENFSKRSYFKNLQGFLKAFNNIFSSSSQKKTFSFDSSRTVSFRQAFFS